MKSYPRVPEWPYTVARPLRSHLMLQILDPTVKPWGVAEEKASSNNRRLATARPWRPVGRALASRHGLKWRAKARARAKGLSVIRSFETSRLLY